MPQMHGRRSISIDRTNSNYMDPKSERPRLQEEKVYWHVHIPKTGGSNNNGILANGFQRVCGGKGNSDTYYQINEFAKRETEENNTTSISRQLIGLYMTKHNLATKSTDCDYVSEEMPWKRWNRMLKKKENKGKPVEMHVPCRDPVDHAMSQCNHGWGHKKPEDGRRALRAANCDTDQLEVFFNSIDKCIIGENRFDMGLIDIFDVKCYDVNQQFTTYHQYMSGRLEHRQIQSLPYIRQDTNSARNKEDECIWKRPDLVKKAEEHLVEKYDYYRFCQACMDSENDITRNAAGLEFVN